MQNLRSRIAGRQSGFTLVEIAIVLVIIGLLLVGVLQGQEMIENTKTKGIVNDMKAIQAAYNGYIDRYKSLPGDETLVATGFRGWTSTVGGNGNGILTAPIAATFTNAAGENQAFWQQLRASGFLSGSPTTLLTEALPKHAAGGMIGIASGTVYNVAGTFVCASGLTSKQAAAIDTLIDGPLPAATQIGNNAGNLLGATAAANPLAPTGAAVNPGAAYNETLTTTWTVCMRIG